MSLVLVFDKWIKSVNNKLSAYVYGSVSQIFCYSPFWKPNNIQDPLLPSHFLFFLFIFILKNTVIHLRFTCVFYSGFSHHCFIEIFVFCL